MSLSRGIDTILTHRALQPFFEVAQSLGGADVAPLASMYLPAHRPCGDAPPQHREQRKSPRAEAVKELGAVNPDVRIGKAVVLALDDQAVFQAEVAARMVGRIGNQYEVRLRLIRNANPGEVDVRPDVGAHEQERPGRQ